MSQPATNKVHTLAATSLERNPGIPFEPDLFGHIRINRSAVERRTASMSKRRSVKKDHQAAWLLRAITCIDLTTLAGDDTILVIAPDVRRARAFVRRLEEISG